MHLKLVIVGLELLLCLSSLGLFVVYLLLLESILKVHFHLLFFDTSLEVTIKKCVGLYALA